MSAPKDAGFTLVEALVSLFVFSLIATGCTIMLMQSVAAQSRVAAAHEALSELQTARSLFNGDMIQIVPRRTRTGEGHAPSFSGAGAEGVDFVRAHIEPDGEGGASSTITHVRYVIDGDRLLRRTWTDLDEIEDKPPSERVVFAGVEAARFEFYDGRAWRENWVSARGVGLPRAVAVIARTPRYGDIRIEAMTGATR